MREPKYPLYGLIVFDGWFDWLVGRCTLSELTSGNRLGDWQVEKHGFGWHLARTNF
jgi:hypothetical protein